jgi:hypothetical protein
MSDLTSEEAAQIKAILNRAERRSQETATKSKNGFFSWLKNTSLGWLVSKLMNLAWEAIKRYIGF